MAKATITVQAPAEHPDVLDIRDAMQQVLDFFDLLSSDDERDTFSWNITFAAMNSPFTATAEAVSLLEGVDVRAIANTRMTEASEYLASVSRGEAPRRQISQRRRNSAKRILRRTTSKIGKTTVSFDSPKTESVILTPSIATVALETVAKVETLNLSYLPVKRERVEFGSIEGVMVDVGTDYNQPAIRVLERKSGREIACRFDNSVVEEISKSANFRDVWEHRRILIRGRIVFDSDGQIVRVYARSIKPLAPRTMTLKDIEDQSFTGALTTVEYLNKLREGELG